MTTQLKDGVFFQNGRTLFSSAFDGAQTADLRDPLSLVARRNLRAQRRQNRSL